MNKRYLAIFVVVLVMVIATLVFSNNSDDNLYNPSASDEEGALATTLGCNFGNDFNCMDYKIDNSLNGVGAFFYLKSNIPENIRITKIYCDFGVGTSEKVTQIIMPSSEIVHLSCVYDGEFPYDDVKDVRVEITYQRNGDTHTQIGRIA